jgi:N-acetylglucosaminyl-diphospho-decaprenol L-rhamnosyltransferase
VKKELISISIVSHGQSQLVTQVLEDLARLPATIDIEILLTINVPEALHFDGMGLPWPIKVIQNKTPKGFGANHNAASHLASGGLFCVMNPDIHLLENPFPTLLGEMAMQQASVIGPAVLNTHGQIEDSIRHSPSILSLAGKMLGRGDGRYSFMLGDDTFAADWLAGMFMLFRLEDYRAIGGFDEGFFLYYEDVDICARLWKSGRSVLACPKTQVIHDARRTSRRDFRYLRWHVASMARYFWKHWGRFPRGVVS